MYLMYLRLHVQPPLETDNPLKPSSSPLIILFSHLLIKQHFLSPLNLNKMLLRYEQR